MSLAMIPTKIWGLIFNQINHNDLYNLMQACRLLRKFVSSHINEKKFNISKASYLRLALLAGSSLKNFYFFKDGSLTDRDIEKVVSSCPKLESLQISWAYNLTNTALTALASLKNLKYLKIQYCDNISDVALKYFLEHDSLQELDLQKCLKISEFGSNYQALCPKVDIKIWGFGGYPCV